MLFQLLLFVIPATIIIIIIIIILGVCLFVRSFVCCGQNLKPHLRTFVGFPECDISLGDKGEPRQGRCGGSRSRLRSGVV